MAKVVAGFPQVLGLSIEANLKPTVAWLEGTGLSRKQVAKAVADFPRLLSCSVDRNLSPKLGLLKHLFRRRNDRQFASVSSAAARLQLCSPASSFGHPAPARFLAEACHGNEVDRCAVCALFSGVSCGVKYNKTYGEWIHLAATRGRRHVVAAFSTYVSH